MIHPTNLAYTTATCVASLFLRRDIDKHNSFYSRRLRDFRVLATNAEAARFTQPFREKPERRMQHFFPRCGKNNAGLLYLAFQSSNPLPSVSVSCRSYSERMTCVEECFSAFEYVAPHRHVAQSCVHAACSRSTLEANDKVCTSCYNRDTMSLDIATINGYCARSKDYAKRFIVTTFAVINYVQSPAKL